MKELSALMGYRESIKVLDATLRDGGLCNDFFFTDEFVKALYKANIRAGVDYMEVGYRADKTMFDTDKFGKWKFSSDEDILSVLGDNKETGLKLSIMTDVGRCNYKEDIRKKSESPVDLIRVATYVHTIPECCAMIDDAKKKGYEVSCNIMAVSNAGEKDVRCALDMIFRTDVDCIYIVDSFGSLYPEQIQRISDVYTEYANKFGKSVGIHAHNNQQMAFANTIEAVGDGIDWIDATYLGMGRGAGNCPIENVIGFLRNPKYNIYPVIKFIEEYMEPLKAEGVKWGYDIQYLLSGLFNLHPRDAIRYSKEGRKDITNFYKEITSNDN